MSDAKKTTLNYPTSTTRLDRNRIELSNSDKPDFKCFLGNSKLSENTLPKNNHHAKLGSYCGVIYTPQAF